MGSERAGGPVACLVTAPPEAARTIALAIVEARLAACVNIVPLVESIYWWEGSVERDEESLLVIKTTRAAVAPVIEAIGAIHPYETFELIALGVEDGSRRYLRWIEDSVDVGAPQVAEIQSADADGE